MSQKSYNYPKYYRTISNYLWDDQWGEGSGWDVWGGETCGDETCISVVGYGEEDGDGVHSRAASMVFKNFFVALCRNAYL